ncbi:MAG TPA: hypothetical protein VGF42_09305 [Caulobacteraceae bacterium]
MRVATSGVLALAVFNLVATSAAADDTTDDVRCLALAAALTANPSIDANEKSASQAVGIYYLGRLDGRTPGLDIKSRLIEQAKLMGAMSVDAIKAQAQVCGAAFGARGRALEELGDALKAAGQPQK